MSPFSYSFWAVLIVLLTLNPSFVLAACCNVDVMKGGFGFDLTGFWVTSLTIKLEVLISSSIFFASSACSRGSDFLLFRLNAMAVFWSFSALNEISQNSSGLNCWMLCSRSTKSLNATDWTLPADKLRAIFAHKSGDNSKPTTLSKNLLACWASTRLASISFGSSKDSRIASLVIWLNLTLE